MLFTYSDEHVRVSITPPQPPPPPPGGGGGSSANGRVGAGGSGEAEFVGAGAVTRDGSAINRNRIGFVPRKQPLRAAHGSGDNDFRAWATIARTARSCTDRTRREVPMDADPIEALLHRGFRYALALTHDRSSA